MHMKTQLPGIDAGQEVLGLSLEEIARAVRADASTLYRWREGSIPTQAYLDRLTRLQELAEEIGRAFAPYQVPYWLNSPAPTFGGKSPREMIRDGRSETVLGALMSLTHLFRALDMAEQGQSGFADLMARSDLSLSTRAALALLDQQVDDLVGGMQTQEARAAAAMAFSTAPRVRIGTGSAHTQKR
jgi:hypothetical protein